MRTLFELHSPQFTLKVSPREGLAEDRVLVHGRRYARHRDQQILVIAPHRDGHVFQTLRRGISLRTLRYPVGARRLRRHFDGLFDCADTERGDSPRICVTCSRS